VALAVRLYQALPRSVRGRVLTAVSLPNQLRLARRVARWPRDLRRPRTGTVAVRDDGRRVNARVVEDATPLAVARDNRDAVLRRLVEAKVPYFLLPHVGMRSVIGVPVEHRDTVMRLMLDEAARNGAHVLRGGGPQRTTASSQDVVPDLSVSYPVTDPYGRWVIGQEYACVIQFWGRGGDRLIAPGADPELFSVPAWDPVEIVRESVLNPFVDASVKADEDEPPARLFPTPQAMAAMPVERVEFPIDAVYTWVDGSDPAWLLRKNLALGGDADTIHETAASASRYVSRDELRYSLRALAYFAPWIRHIYLITADQVPQWLRLDHPRLTVVSHRELFGDRGTLPTFNSHAIETQLHHIPGLAEHFIYFNDDVFLGRPLVPTRFFHANGIAKFFLSSAQIGFGPPTIADQPVNAAAKNNRRILIDRFGRLIYTKMRHAPIPLLRSVLEEIETSLEPEIKATASHQFRHQDDLAVPSSLHHYWAYLTGRSVPGRIRYRYVNLAHPWSAIALPQLLRERSHDVFCLNDTDNHPDAVAEQEAMMARFLPAYFPFRSEFERDPEDYRIGRQKRELADDPAGGRSADAPVGDSERTYSGAWQTASTLLPSGSRTKAPK
jgi:hypothetical protein